MSAFTTFLTMFAFILTLAPASLAQTETCEFAFYYYGLPALMTPSGLNNLNTVVGTYFDPENRSRGFIRFQDGRVASYQIPNLSASQWVFLKGINNKGQIVGYVSDEKESGFVITGENVAPIAFPEAYWTAPSSINDVGDVVGTYLRGNESGGGFLYKGGQFTTLFVPGSLTTAPSGINNTGVIVGSFADSKSVNHGFVRIGHRYVTLDFPGSSWTMLMGINNRGEIVGDYAAPPGPVRGFVYKEGRFETVNVPDMYSAQAFAINSGGDLAGLTFTADYSQTGFLGAQCR
jgi:hypothetical protein